MQMPYVEACARDATDLEAAIADMASEILRAKQPDDAKAIHVKPTSLLKDSKGDFRISIRYMHVMHNLAHTQ